METNIFNGWDIEESVRVLTEKACQKIQQKCDRRSQQNNFRRLVRNLRPGNHQQVNPTIKRLFNGKEGR